MTHLLKQIKRTSFFFSFISLSLLISSSYALQTSNGTTTGNSTSTPNTISSFMNMITTISDKILSLGNDRLYVFPILCFIFILIVARINKKIKSVQGFILLMLILFDPLLKIVLIQRINRFANQNLATISENIGGALFLCMFVLTQYITFNLVLAILYTSKILTKRKLKLKQDKKYNQQSKQNTEGSIGGLIFIIISFFINYKFYCLSILEQIPCCKINLYQYRNRQTTKKYIKHVGLEMFFILVQIVFMIEYCTYVPIIIIFCAYQTVYIVFLARLIKHIYMLKNNISSEKVARQSDNQSQTQTQSQNNDDKQHKRSEIQIQPQYNCNQVNKSAESNEDQNEPNHLSIISKQSKNQYEHETKDMDDNNPACSDRKFNNQQ